MRSSGLSLEIALLVIWIEIIPRAPHPIPSKKLLGLWYKLEFWQVSTHIYLVSENVSYSAGSSLIFAKVSMQFF